MMKNKFYVILILVCIIMAPSVYAQVGSVAESENHQQEKIDQEAGVTFSSTENSQIKHGNTQENTEFKPSYDFGFLAVGGYSFGLDDHTTGDGKYMPKDSEETSNTFFLRYARVNGVFKLTPKLQANLLINLADFKNDEISKKVLEIASITYKHSKALNLRVGQFRPYFGIENTYGVAYHKAYYWTNAYNLMGKSHWQSFQIGASLYGDLREQNIPIKYYVNVYNGNGKNQIKDNDSNKNISGRLLLMPIKGVEIGANYAFAKHLEEDIHAAAFDLKTYHTLSAQWKLNTEFSYSFGNNLGDAIKNNATANTLDDYEFKGWYFIPQLVYEVNSPYLKSVELSCKYESLYDNLEDDKNLKTSISPLVGFNISNRFKTSIVGVFDRYDEEIPVNGDMNTSWMLLQLQFNY